MSEKHIGWVTWGCGILVAILLYTGAITTLDIILTLGYFGYLLVVYPGLRKRLLKFSSTQILRLRSNLKQIALPVVTPETPISENQVIYSTDRQIVQPEFTPVPAPRSGIQVYTVKLHRGGEYRPDLAYALIQKLASLGEIALRIVAEENSVRWQVVDVTERYEPSYIVQAIRSVYPDATVEVNDLNWQPTALPLHRLTYFFKQTNIFAAPIRYAKEMKNDDPVNLIANTFSHVGAGERVSYVVYIGKPDASINKAGLEQITLSKWMFRDAVIFVGSLVTFVGSLFGLAYIMWRAATGKRRDKYQATDMNVFYEKLSDTLFPVYVGVQIDSPIADRTAHFDIAPAVMQFGNSYQTLSAYMPQQGELSNLYYEITAPTQERHSDMLYRMFQWATKPNKAPTEARNILNTSELAAIWHLPYQGMLAEGIEWARGKHVPLPARLRGKRDGVCLGINAAQGREEPVFLPYASRTTPMMIVGKAGVGKSNLMHQMVHQDVAAGQAVVVIDPHGTLVRDILQRSIPPEREDDVVLIDLANTLNPPPLNPLRGLSGEVAVARTVDIFNKLYPELRNLPQTSDVLENALMTLQGLPDAILWDVDRLFANSEFRTQLLAKSKDPIVKRFWRDEYEGISKPQQLQMSAPISRRLRRFYRSEDLRAILCHPQGMDLGQLVQQRKIVLISLRARENTIPEQEQRLIGALIVSRLQMAAMSEAFRDVPCYCYIDELQNFVTAAIDQVFSEARKFNLSLTMANQYLHQLKGDALQAAMGNVSTLAVFQVGQEDARALAVYTRPGFEVDDLTSLDKYNAALWMRYDSATESAFSLATMPPVPLPNNAQEIEARIRAKSIEQYTPMTRQEVLSWLEQREEEGGKAEHSEADPNEEWFDPRQD